jgi:hypothetical protein
MSLNISPRTGAAVARYVGTVAMTVLVAIQPSYPNAHWVTPVLFALGMLGFHAVPTAVQVVQKLMPSTVTPVQTPPVPTPASQAGPTTAATEGLPKGT